MTSIGALTAHLACPICGGGLNDDMVALRCPYGHSFDIARQGYAQLTAGPLRHTGDSPDMVAARTAFLGAGHYAFVARELAAAIPPRTGGLIADIGASSGYHLGHLLDAAPAAVGLALDASKAAIRQAARAHPRAAAAVCDVWRRLPLADGTASVLLNVFAPRHPAEFRRVLAPGGTLLVVTPEPDHLTELVAELGLLRIDPDKERRLAADLGAAAAEQPLRRRLVLDRPALRALVAMGPNAWHADPDAVNRLPEPFEVTASIRLRRYHLG